jgi:hypothetical protein
MVCSVTMIRALNQQIISAIKAEMAWQGFTQFDLSLRLGKRPEYLQRRLAGTVPLSINDVEDIGVALDTNFVRPILPLARRAS